MSEQDNVELVQRAYAAHGRGDVEYVLSCLSPQIDWEIPAVPALSFTGKRHGAAAVADYFRLSSEQQVVRELTPKEFIAQGDKVVVLGHGGWTAKQTGQDFDSDWVHVFTVKDGKIAAFREFMDVHVAVEAFGCYPLAAGTAATAPAAH